VREYEHNWSSIFCFTSVSAMEYPGVLSEAKSTPLQWVELRSACMAAILEAEDMSTKPKSDEQYLEELQQVLCWLKFWPRNFS
jgi:alpha-D-ribose 1-methylphosphonate 5-triphosphate synthase subunit PhnH